MTWSVGARAAPLTPLPHWPAAQPAPNAAGGTLLPVASESAFACSCTAPSSTACSSALRRFVRAEFLVIDDFAVLAMDAAQSQLEQGFRNARP